MFAKVSERRMRLVRGLLVVGWLVLIASLFWDPVSHRLNDPANTASPFRLDRAATSGDPAARYSCPLRTTDEAGNEVVDWRGHEPGTCDPRCPRVQGACVVEQPYAMGARLFWTIILPIVPFFLLVFGHEAWRRICPLSALMQIPRQLGIQRKRRSVNVKTGLVDEKLVLPRASSWLAKNFWYLQFSLLWLGVSLRLVFINSDRIALAIFFIAVIMIAIAIGYLFGGKTWCNYICPLSPVQKMYTEPRGLLESKAHMSAGLPQSMCRTIDDQSSCVGCKSPCPDTDLERQYWTELTMRGRRFFYYGYFGLVVGFYTYYRLYSGNWDYYFSGAWTHEEGQVDAAFSPGFYLGGEAIAIPKIVAAPLSIAVFILAAFGIGSAIERIYARWRESRGRPVPEQELLHKGFSLSAFFTFNAFYLFGGRPNLNLLPAIPRFVVDAGIIALSAVWLARTWPRSNQDYERESVVNTLRRQLGKLKLDFQKLFGGRNLDQLSSDEVYVLAKTLPTLSEQERMRTYKETLRESLAAGHAGNAAGLSVLAEIREQMGISEDEHNAVLTELGIEDQSLLDPTEAVSAEERLRLQSFREAIASMVERWSDRGMSVVEALEDDAVREDIRRLQTTYSIDPDELGKVLDDLFGKEDIALRQARDVIEEIARLLAWDACFAARARGEGDGTPYEILRRVIARRWAQLAERAVGMLGGVTHEAAAAEQAAILHALVPEEAERVAADLRFGDDGHGDGGRATPAAVLAALKGEHAGPVQPPAIERSLEPGPILGKMIHQWEPVARAVALWAQAGLDRAAARAEAQALLGNPDVLHWLVAVTARAAASPAAHLEVPAEMVRLARLYESPFFNHLEPDTLAQLARSATLRSYRAGDILCREGDPSDELLYVTRGTAEVWIESDDGRHRVATVESGQTIGELGVLTRAPRTATVSAADGGAEVLVIQGQRLDRLFATNGRAATSFLRLTGERLARTLDQLRS